MAVIWATGTTIRATINASMPGSTILNCLHLRLRQDFANGNLLAKQVSDNWSFRINGNLNGGQMTYNSVRVDSVSDPTTPPGFYAQSLTYPGGDTLPPQVAMKLILQTAHRGRTGTGRIFVGGVRVAHNTGGAINSAGLAALATWVTDMTARFIGDAASSGLKLLIRSSSAVGGFRDVTGVSYSTVWSTLRSRRIGVGI